MKTAWLIGALIGATVLAYRNTIPGQFIYDDRPIIVKNPLIRNLNQIPLILGTSYWGTNIGQPKEFKGGLYRPLTIISFALNYWVGGLNPNGYHVANLVLHIGTALLLGLLAMRLGFSWRGAYATAFLFALLPIHTEAVSNVVGRSEELAAFFVLLSWFFSIGKPRPLFMGLGAFSFALALLSKENAAAFLPILVFSDYVTTGKPWKTILRERLMIWMAYAGTLFLYLEWKYFMLGSIAYAGGIPYFESQNMLTILLTMSRFSVEHYLKPLLLGISFCTDYTRPSLQDASFHEPWAWGCVLFLAVITISCFMAAFKKKNREALFWLIGVVFLLPVLNLFTPLEVIGAERFLYLPSIGYCLGLGFFFERILRSSKRWAYAMLCGMLLWYGWGTYHRNRAWESEETFWKTTVQEAPQSPRAWNGVGLVAMHQKKYDEAISFFRKAFALNPLLLDALYNIATVHFIQQRYAEAQKEYLQVLLEKPFDPDTLFHLAFIDESDGHFKSAAHDYALILKANPFDQMAKRNLERLLAKKPASQRIMKD